MKLLKIFESIILGTVDMKKNKFNVVSLFSGCGGIDLGFIGGFTSYGRDFVKTGLEVVWANDIDKNACLTFSKNLNKPIVCGDIREILAGKYPDCFSPQMPKTADIVTGGFPCQDFSLAGKRRGLKANRGKLYQSMVEVVRRLKPALFVAENVKGLLTIDNGGAIDLITDDFSELGYTVNYKLFHVADFGIPQNRERVIIVGTSDKHDLPPFSFELPNKIEKLCLGDIIGDLENKGEGEIDNHYWSKAKYFPGTQGNTFVNKSKIGPTMRAEHHGNIEWHWNRKRRLSAREAARIQSFPDNFVFYPSTSSAYRQIGNAVPPVFAWYLARNIQKFLNDNLWMRQHKELTQYSMTMS